MNLARKALTTLGGVFLAALLLSALAPKVTRAVVATLVQVANTSANPIPIEDNGARHPYQATLCYATDGACSSFSDVTTPASQRLVVEDVSGICKMQNSELIFVEVLARPQGAFNSYYLAPNPTVTDPFGNNLNIFHQAAHWYIEPGAPLFLEAYGLTPAGQPGVFDCQAIVSGYLINP